MTQFYKSVLEQDPSPVVLCDLEHRIVYMNPSAILRYSRYGGSDLLEKNLLNCHREESRRAIERVLCWFHEDQTHNCVHTYYDDEKKTDIYMVALRDEAGELIGYYERHCDRNPDPGPLYRLEP